MGSATVHPVEIECSSEEQRYTRKSLGFISIESPFRKYLLRLIVPGSHFDNFVLVTIVLNAVTMACIDYRYVDENYDPISEHSLRNRAIEVAEFAFMIIFILECAIKIVALGLVKGKEAYLRNSWNIFDFLIVIMR